MPSLVIKILLLASIIGPVSIIYILFIHDQNWPALLVILLIILTIPLYRLLLEFYITFGRPKIITKDQSSRSAHCVLLIKDKEKEGKFKIGKKKFVFKNINSIIKDHF